MTEGYPGLQRCRLHVFLITPMFPPGPGGGGMHAFYLAKALGNRQGIRVHLFADASLPDSVGHWLRSDRISIYRTNFVSESTGVPYGEAIRKCLEVYTRVRWKAGNRYRWCSVIHGQHFAGLFIGLHLKTRFGAPLVVTLHKTPIGRAHGQTIADRDSTYAHLSLLTEWPINKFVAGSRFFSRELEKLGVIEKVASINHGVPVQWLQSRGDSVGVRKAKEYLGIDSRDDLIVCPIRYDPRKNPKDLILAAGIVRRKLPDKRLRLLITGGDPDKLKNEAAEQGLQDAVILKEIPFEWFHPVLRAATICVVPTKREGLGLSVLEALALKKPVVATDVEGIREIITNETSGCLYPEGNAEHLALYLQRLLLDGEFRQRIAKGGYTEVSKNFSDEIMADEHEKLYRSFSQQG